MNINSIIKMLEYSGISYNDSEFLENGEIIRSITDPETDVSYHIRVKGDTLTVAFRGSDSKKDWSFNLDFFKKVIPYGNRDSEIRVHSGFISAYKSRNVRGIIRSFVSDSIKKIRLTGHSYGAALAILCAVDLQYTFSDRDYEVVVFGCPRVGNSAFRNSYNKRIFKTLRVENTGDIITKVPFALMGFRHVGARLLLKGSGFSGVNPHYLQEYYSNIWAV